MAAMVAAASCSVSDSSILALSSAKKKLYGVRGPRGLRGLDRPEKDVDTGTLLLRLPVPMGVVLVVVAVPVVGDLLEAMTIVDLFWCWILYVVDDPACQK